jgi:hypothetical protein
MTTGYHGEPTENDVVDRFDGTVAWKDRSLGCEFVAVENKKSGSKGIATATTTAVAAAATVATVTTESTVALAATETTATAYTTELTDNEEEKKMSTMELMRGEKLRMDRACREYGIEPCNLAALAPKRFTPAAPLQTSLAASLASGGAGSTGIGKLTMLQSKTVSKKAVTVEAKVDKAPKLDVISNESGAQNHQAARGIGGLFRSAVGAMKSGQAAKTAAAVMAAAGARPKVTTTEAKTKWS